MLQTNGMYTIIDKHTPWIEEEMDICRKGNSDPLKIEDKSLITYKTPGRCDLNFTEEK